MPIFQPSFAAGVISPALWGRTDQAKYHIGAARLENFYCKRFGGAATRPGTKFIMEYDGATVLIPFNYDVDTTYMLVMKANEFKVIKDQGIVQSGGVDLTVVHPFSAADLPNVRYWQEENVMYFAHPDYAPRRLTTTSDTAWTWTVLDFDSDPAPEGVVAFNDYTPSGNTAKFYYRVSTVGDNGIESLATDPIEVEVELPWPAFGVQNVHIRFNSLRDTRWQWTVSASGTDEYYLEAAGGGNPGISEPSELWEDETKMTVGTLGSLSAGEWDYGDNDTLGYSTVYVRLTSATADPDGNPVGHIQFGPFGDYGIYKSVDGNIYGEIGGVDNPDEITPSSQGFPAFLETAPLIPQPRGPRDGRNPFDSDRPAAVCTWDQRLTFGRMPDEPNIIHQSRLGRDNYENFDQTTPGTLLDAREFTPDSRKLNGIQYLIPAGSLLIMTSGTIWACEYSTKPIFQPVTDVGVSETATPITSENVVLIVSRGGNDVYDLAPSDSRNGGFIGRSLTLYARHLFDGHAIRSWAHAENPDGVVWCVTDTGRLYSFTYVREEDVRAWAGPHYSDGTWKWTASAPKSGSNQDDIYFIIQRDGGTYIEVMTQRTVGERDVSEIVQVDSSLSYSGAATDTFTGLDHLNGQTVIAQADGSVYGTAIGLVVSGGSITLPDSHSTVHIGLPFTGKLETLDVDEGDGQVLKRRKRFVSAHIGLESSRWIYVGVDESSLEWQPWRTDEDWEEADPLKTGNLKVNTPAQWGTNDDPYRGRLFIQSEPGSPLEIQNIYLNIDFGG